MHCSQSNFNLLPNVICHRPFTEGHLYMWLLITLTWQLMERSDFTFLRNDTIMAQTRPQLHDFWISAGCFLPWRIETMLIILILLLLDARQLASQSWDCFGTEPKHGSHEQVNSLSRWFTGWIRSLKDERVIEEAYFVKYCSDSTKLFKTVVMQVNIPLASRQSLLESERLLWATACSLIVYLEFVESIGHRCLSGSHCQEQS